MTLAVFLLIRNDAPADLCAVGPNRLTRACNEAGGEERA
jgi:hypothetical protein